LPVGGETPPLQKRRMSSTTQHPAGPAPAERLLDPVEVLNDLVQAEQECVCNFLVHGAACEGASAPLRRLLAEMCEAGTRHAQVLSELIDAAGGDVRFRRPCAEEQYLGYLSLNYLLPKLIEAKQSQIVAYERAIASLAGEDHLVSILIGCLQEHRKQLERLKAA
jgi:hypothetical protein